MFFQALINLFMPKSCYACASILNDGEIGICTACRHDLPVTNAHFTQTKIIERVLYGRADIARGTALFRFEKQSKVQHLIHNLKYKRMEAIGVLLGRWLGNELKEIDSYKTIERVIPVPLHPKKLRKRGYNQVDRFGQELANALGCHYSNNVLLKISNTKSQVTKNRFSRWNKLESIFSLKNPDKIKGKHILIVDDIITTGATLEKCITVLKPAKPASISIATMAIA